MVRPGDEGNDLVAITKITDEYSTLAIVLDLLAPILNGVHVGIGEARRHWCTAGPAVETVQVSGASAGVVTAGQRPYGGVFVDAPQLIVVTCVGMRIVERIGIIHAGVEVRAGFILVVEAPIMANLLADHMLLVRVGVAGRQVRVIQLCSRLGDMHSARDPDLRQSEPAIKAVVGIAGMRLAGNSLAALARALTVTARFLCQGQHGGLIPIGNGCVELAIPVRGYAVNDLEGYRVGSPRPVISAPGMVCVSG